MISFAGVMLCDPDDPQVDQQVIDWVQANARPAELFPLAYRTWPNSLTGGPILDITPDHDRPVRIGTCWWPWGASRFARAHYIISESQLNAIRIAIQTPAGTNKAAKLSLKDGTREVAATMYMLPAWPLLTAVAGAGAYLLSLADARYWWWSTPLSLSVTAGVTAWTDLYTAIGTAMGLTIAVDSIPAAYLTPTADYAPGYRPLPAVLDAIAFSVGQRICVSLDGSVKAQNSLTAIASVTAQLASLTSPYTGGKFSLLPG